MNHAEWNAKVRSGCGTQRSGCHSATAYASTDHRE